MLSIPTTQAAWRKLERTAADSGEFRWYCPHANCTNHRFKDKGITQRNPLSHHIRQSHGHAKVTGDKDLKPVLKCTWKSCDQTHVVGETLEDLLLLHLEQKKERKDGGAQKRA